MVVFNQRLDLMSVKVFSTSVILKQRPGLTIQSTLNKRDDFLVLFLMFADIGKVRLW